MLYEAIVIGVIIGWLAHGRLANLAKLKLRHIWLVFLALALEIGMEFAWSHGVKGILPWRMFIQGLIYLLLFVFLWLHRDLPGTGLLALGFFMNFAVIMMNGGAMPSTLSGLDGETTAMLKSGGWLGYTVLTEGTRLPWLADVLVLPWPKAKTFSSGDVFISIGIIWLVFKSMQGISLSGKLTSVREMRIS